MERLEAALEKARQDRQAAQVNAVVKGPVRVGVASADAHWAALPQLELSARVARDNRISTLKSGNEAVPYDLLRTRVLRQMRENNWKTLAVTSPNSECGKTTVCANLAFSLSRQQDMRVMVLDLDLRRPAMHKLLAVASQRSLAAVLGDDGPFERALVRFEDNLIFGLNRRPADSPSELLQSKHTLARLQELQETYKPDLTIIDMPPMLAGDDTVGFLPNVDCAILVGAADSTSVAQIDVGEKEIAGLTNVLGVVLNKCRYLGSEATYDYNY